jgi:4'-phosphopantetheinyl transferase
MTEPAPANAPGKAVSHATGRPTDCRVWLVDLAAAPDLLSRLAIENGLWDGPASATAAAPLPRDVAHAALRIILAGYVGVAAARRPFRIAAGGKPHLGETSDSEALAFSLSHGATAALVAISRDGPVGVDLETPRSPRIAASRRTALIAAAASLSLAIPLPDDDGDTTLLQAWTRLEALAKATGEGIGAVLERIRHAGPAIADTAIDGAAVKVRDLAFPPSPTLPGQPLPPQTLYGAIAGVGRALAAPRPLPVTRLPLDRDRLQTWIRAGGSDPDITGQRSFDH